MNWRISESDRRRRHPGPSEWEKAGFTDEHSGQLGRTVPSGHVLVPGSIELDGLLLVWKNAPHANAQPKTYIPSGDVLNRFVGLWKDTPVDETIRPVLDPADTPTQAKTKLDAYIKTMEARFPAARDRTLRFARKCGILGLDRGAKLAFPYMRAKKHKKPNAGQANFCPSCGREEALRQANRRLQKKRVEARRLHAEGIGLKQIAERLYTNAASVRRWIAKGK